MLKAYLDESYNPGRIIVAGFIGTDAEWDRVGGEWAEALKRRDAPYFHACEIVGQRKAFARWETWRCDALRGACADVLAGSALGEVMAGFVGDWSEVLRQCPSIEDRFPTAYAFCFELIVAQMQRAANRWYGGDNKVACWFDVQDEHSAHAAEIFKQRKASGLWANVASVAYASDLDVIQLQCADMISNESYNAPKLGSENLPLLSKIHKAGRFFSGRKQWDETLIPAYWRDPELKDIFYPKEMPAPTSEEHAAHMAIVAKYKHLDH